MSALPAYTYAATLIDIHDGDTLRCNVDLGCDVHVNLTVRFYGLNAPELSTPEGKTALAWVQQWFAANCPDGRFVLQTIKDHREKYGRYLGTMFAVGGTVSINDAEIAAGQAVPYFGGQQ